MSRILVAWIGNTDLRATTSDADGLGPIAGALDTGRFQEAWLLSDYPEARAKPYLDWLQERSEARLYTRWVTLSSPTAFGEIYLAARQHLAAIQEARGANAALTFHLSPGTPAMAAVWILLAKTLFPAELLQSSRQAGVEVAQIPFDISAEFIPDLLARQDSRIRSLAAGLPPEAPEFVGIIHQSASMQRVLAMARRAAPHNVPVLIEGESGTGKELLARAIHQASPRGARSLVVVNCGAIAENLIESELFGYKKGAFTGATQDREGLFAAADGSTIFLDEIGEMPLGVQVRLLRVLQEGEVLPIGAQKPRKIDVRVIAATNRALAEEVDARRFREDLFYRLAVVVLHLPPLREREGDLGLLIEHLLAQINLQGASGGGWQEKKLSVATKNLLLRQPWPGNVRELFNTLWRAAIWSSGSVIEAEDLQNALLPRRPGRAPDVLGRPLGQGLDIQAVLADVARHYLSRAMSESGGNKTKAAELVGLGSYQTLTNWLARYRVGEGAEEGPG